ncbi:hypothetical protein PTKIN_Ptkin17bG0082200 [Pterospermum kingtungense]
MNQIVVKDQVAMTIDNDENSCVSSASNQNIIDSDRFGDFVKNGLVKIDDSGLEDSVIKTSFFLGMVRNMELAKETKIVAIHKNLNSSWSGKARLQSFRVFSEAVADKCGGDANIKSAWYGASRDEIFQIVKHGFSWSLKATGNGISLSSEKFSLDSVLSSEVDEFGLKHLLLCRVILGKQEVVTTNSNRFHPSSPEFDSGVDDLSAPRKYFFWSAYMNSYILPRFIISFKAPYLMCPKGLPEVNTIKQPRLPWIRFTALISLLSMFLSPSEIASLNRQYRQFREKRISRPQLIQRVKAIAGNQLLAAVVNMYKSKAGTSSLQQQQEQRKIVDAIVVRE